jgi:BirA family biotin operon repressor/biotin-[acetyl-CoA-carboxylase] ligase
MQAVSPSAGPPPPYRLLVLEEVDSTNEEARRYALRGDTHPPLWIRALRQTAGRGRRGRSWHSGSGNLAASLLMVPHAPANAAARLSLVAALAVYDMVASFCPSTPAGLKWPNDVLLDGRKIGGILLEAGGENAKRELAWLVIGIGVNISSHPEETLMPATHLHLHVDANATLPAAEQCFARLAAAFAQWFKLWQEKGFQPIRAAWLERATGLGAPLTIRLPNTEFMGIFETLDDEGNLLARMASGEIRVIEAGEVYFSSRSQSPGTQ